MEDLFSRLGRRECLTRGGRFNTYEYVEKTPVMVVPRDGRRLAFDRQFRDLSEFSDELQALMRRAAPPLPEAERNPTTSEKPTDQGVK